MIPEEFEVHCRMPQSSLAAGSPKTLFADRPEKFEHAISTEPVHFCLGLLLCTMRILSLVGSRRLFSKI